MCARRRARNQFDRDSPVKPRVIGGVDNAHPAAPNAIEHNKTIDKVAASAGGVSSETQISVRLVAVEVLVCLPCTEGLRA